MGKTDNQIFLRRMALVLKTSQKEKEQYTLEILQKEFVVYPGVFSPKYFFDTEIYAELLPINKGERFLEVGCGTGVISVFAALRGAAGVTALDINAEAVKNTRANVTRHGLDDVITVLQSDVYDALDPQDTFDTIFWNTPFGYIHKDGLSVLEQSVFDSGYVAHKKFIEGAKRHLNDSGRLLIGFSSTLGNWERLEQLLRESDFSYSLLIEKEHVDKIATVKFEVFEALPNC